MIRTAILVDGGFYRKRAAHLWGHKTAEQRAAELSAYCQAHLKDGREDRYLYRIFYKIKAHLSHNTGICHVSNINLCHLHVP